MFDLVENGLLASSWGFEILSSLLFAVYRLGRGNALPGGGAGSFVGAVSMRGQPSEGFFSPFGAVGELIGCVQSRELGARASSSEVYPAGKIQWHFTCGIDFRHLWLSFVAGFAVLKRLKRVLWEILQNSQKPSVPEKRDCSAGVFLWILQNVLNTFFTEHHHTTASDYSSINSGKKRICKRNGKLWYKKNR